MICGMDLGIPVAVADGIGAVSTLGPCTDDGCIWMLLGIAGAVPVFVPVG